MASMVKGIHYTKERYNEGETEIGKGHRIWSDDSQLRHRSMGTRKQKERRWRVGSGEGIGGQQGSNEGWQANRPRPHVSMMGTRKITEKTGSRPVQGNQAQDEGGKDLGAGGGKCAEGEGNTGRNG